MFGPYSALTRSQLGKPPEQQRQNLENLKCKLDSIITDINRTVEEAFSDSQEKAHSFVQAGTGELYKQNRVLQTIKMHHTANEIDFTKFTAQYQSQLRELDVVHSQQSQQLDSKLKKLDDDAARAKIDTCIALLKTLQQSFNTKYQYVQKQLSVVAAEQELLGRRLLSLEELLHYKEQNVAKSLYV